MRDSVLELAAAAARLPIVLGLTALGAGVVIGRRLLGILSRLIPGGAAGRTPRHHAGNVREQIRAAKQAARAAGVLGPRARR